MMCNDLRMTAESFIQLRINDFVFCMYEKKVFFRLFGKNRHTNGLRVAQTKWDVRHKRRVDRR